MNWSPNLYFFEFATAITILLFLSATLTMFSQKLQPKRRNQVTFLIRFGLPIIVFGTLLAGTFGDNLLKYGLTLPDKMSWLWICPLLLSFIIGTYFQSAKQSVYESMPYLKYSKWNLRTHCINAISWTIYLFGYEFLIRGLLLTESLQKMSLPAAVILNVMIYCVVHLPKTRLEIVGSIPLGLLLCAITIQSGSFIPAFAIHTIMAVSVDSFSLYHARRIMAAARMKVD